MGFLIMNQNVICIFCITFCLLHLWVGSVQAQDYQCPRHVIETSLQGKLAKTRIYRGSTKAFTEYVTGHDRGTSRILGFVNQAEIYTRLNYKFDVQTLSNGYHCVLLKQVQGYFYAAPKLFMPSDYDRKSCEYQQIYKHESRHLDAVYKFHKKNTGKYAVYLGKIAREVPILDPVRTKGEVQGLKQQIANYFEGKFRELEYKSIIQLNREQAKIDSPQEYIGVSKRCSNW